jgi:hypothetical protein
MSGKEKKRKEETVKEVLDEFDKSNEKNKKKKHIVNRYPDVIDAFLTINLY